MQRLKMIFGLGLGLLAFTGCSDDEESGGGAGKAGADAGIDASAGNGGTGGAGGAGGTGGTGGSGGSGGAGGNGGTAGMSGSAGASGMSGAGGAAGGAGASGAAGGGGAAGGAGQSGASGAGGAGGGTGGTGGTGGMAGMAGTSGTAGGAGVSGSSLCSCTEPGALDLTSQAAVTVVFAPNFYAPDCIKVKVGTTVTFSGDFGSHPQSPFTTLGTHPNPIPAKSSGSSSPVTFNTAGSFGYFCAAHGSEAEVGGDMCGAVYVVP